MNYIIKRRGRVILTGNYSKQRIFFFKLYFFLLFNGRFGRGGFVRQIIRDNYILLDWTGKQHEIYC